jgi:hypothetical protein
MANRNETGKRLTTLHPKSPIFSSPFKPTNQLSTKWPEAALTDQDILGLDIPMHHMLLVKI